VPSSLPPQRIFHGQIQLNWNTSFEAEHKLFVFPTDVNSSVTGHVSCELIPSLIAARVAVGSEMKNRSGSRSVSGFSSADRIRDDTLQFQPNGC
jgi:hypothetical protein